MVKNPLAMQEMQETRVRSLGQEDPLEKKMATHYCILAWGRNPKKLDATEHADTHAEDK